MRTINGEIMRVKPFDCPAGYANANCVKCNYRVGRVTTSPEKGLTVRCCWEESMRRKKEDKDE